MDTKKWYLSKGIWAGIIGILVVLYNTLVSALVAGCDPATTNQICVVLPGIPEWVLGALAAMGLYGRGAATTRIG